VDGGQGRLEWSSTLRQWEVFQGHSSVYQRPPVSRRSRVYFLGADLVSIEPAFRSYLCGSYDPSKSRISELFLNKRRNTKNIRRPEWFFACM
jgi:hypothetical protein